MGTKRIAILTALLAFFLAGAVFAGETKAMTTSGEVAEVMAKMNRLSVSTGEGEKAVFQVNEKTTILRDGVKIGLADIAVGDKVTVSYEQAKDTKVALAIGIERKEA